MDRPWLWIIGIGEDGLTGLSDASLAALAAAEIVFGGPRHLALARVGARGQAWPVPFSVAPVLACRGRAVAVLTSGDPFWHGAGGSLAGHLTREEWESYPVPSSFALAANRLGWPLEATTCLGLHANAFAMLRPHLWRGQRLICTLRDAAALAELAAWLTAQGAEAQLHALERLGGQAERIRTVLASGYALTDVQAPVLVGIEMHNSMGLPSTPGLPDRLFQTDGQITKQPVRALTLSALAPRTGALLWDIGAGSGSIAVEWGLQGGRAIAVETRADRLANIAANIAQFGLQSRIDLVQADVSGGQLPAVLTATQPDAVFIGGGADEALLSALFAILPPGVRLVLNTVTLESESLVLRWQAARGGSLLRIDLAQAAPLGRLHGWQPARPVVQWNVLT
ncbi:MAG: precorrin-6y C5,15-methyltransferase (decarboxylating) subunit CbiE [Rhodobacteraceae bacterium]|nr:precorrin-6y C5,15-methyltransferase (decarboxylating) subunit CbiE [Paracoccaceae bacterium]